jgi:hypothetical protein
MIDQKGDWVDGITWDDLQKIKNECGFEDYDAIEDYPKKKEVVAESNIRHLWVLRFEDLPFIWRKK